jgi:hypothetical protein
MAYMHLSSLIHRMSGTKRWIPLIIGSRNRLQPAAHDVVMPWQRERAVDGTKSPSRDLICTSPLGNKNWLRGQEVETKYSTTANWRCNENKG